MARAFFQAAEFQSYANFMQKTGYNDTAMPGFYGKVADLWHIDIWQNHRK